MYVLIELLAKGVESIEGYAEHKKTLVKWLEDRGYSPVKGWVGIWGQKHGGDNDFKIEKLKEIKE